MSDHTKTGKSSLVPLSYSSQIQNCWPKSLKELKMFWFWLWAHPWLTVYLRNVWARDSLILCVLCHLWDSIKSCLSRCVRRSKVYSVPRIWMSSSKWKDAQKPQCSVSPCVAVGSVGGARPSASLQLQRFWTSTLVDVLQKDVVSRSPAGCAGVRRWRCPRWDGEIVLFLYPCQNKE